MNRSIYILSIILMLLIAILVKQQSNLAIKQSHVKQPKEYMHHLQVYNYDTEGKINNHLTANSWEFIPTKQYSTVNKPKLSLYKTNKYHYYISADSGQIMQTTLDGKVELIKLSSSVLIQQAPKQSTPTEETGFNLTTNYLEFNPNSKIASTKQPVTIHKPGLVVTSDGMKANLETHQLTLTKNVVTKYQH